MPFFHRSWQAFFKTGRNFGWLKKPIGKLLLKKLLVAFQVSRNHWNCQPFVPSIRNCLGPNFSPFSLNQTLPKILFRFPSNHSPGLRQCKWKNSRRKEFFSGLKIAFIRTLGAQYSSVWAAFCLSIYQCTTQAFSKPLYLQYTISSCKQYAVTYAVRIYFYNVDTL